MARPTFPLRHILFAGCAALALAACGEGEEEVFEAAVAPSDARAASVSSGSPFDTPFKMSGAEEVDLDRFFALLPPTLRPTYQATFFDSDTGATVATGLNFPIRAKREGDRVVYDLDVSGLQVERAEFFGLDIDAAETAAAVDGARVLAAGELAQLFEKVRLYGVSVAEETDEAEGEISIAGIEIDRLAVRGGAFAEDDGENHLASASFGGLYFKDAVLAGGEEDGTALTLRAPDMRFVGVGEGKIGAIIANNLEYLVVQGDTTADALNDALGGIAGGLLDSPVRDMLAPSNQRTSIGSFAWRGINYEGLLPYRSQDETPPTSARDLIDLGRIEIKDVDSFVNGKQFMRAPLTEVTDLKFDWLAPSKIRGETKGAVYDFSAYLGEGDVEAAQIISDYGLNNLTTDSTFDYDWDADNGDAKIATNVSAPGFVRFRSDVDLAGLRLRDVDPAAAAEDGVGALFAQSKLAGLDIVIEDQQFLDAAFALASLNTGGSTENVRQSLPALVRIIGMQFVVANPSISGYVNAVADFLEDGGTLSITADPEQPVDLDDLNLDDPTALPDVLNLKVEHSE